MNRLRTSIKLTGVVLVAMLTTLHMPSTSVGQQLLPYSELERLLTQTEEQVRSGNYSAAVATYDRILNFLEESTWDIPTIFWFNDARLAQQAGLHARAMESATRYLTTSDQDGEFYGMALQLLNDAQTQLGTEARRLAEEAEARRLAEEAEARRLAEEAESQEALMDWTLVVVGAALLITYLVKHLQAP